MDSPTVTSSDQHSMSGDEQEEKTSFLRSEQQLNRHHDATTTTTTTRFFDSYNLRLWQFATAVLTVLLVVSVYFNQWLGPGPSYETGFDTDLGSYVALTKSEAERIGSGHVSEDGGAYFVVTHVRHSLHCVNYLRKVAYEKWYPTIRHENKSSVPTFWQHVDHCVETLRQTIQCQSDLTPVPHVWSEGKGMYIADTSLEHTCRDYDAVMEWQDERERAWKAGEIHD
ncbi:hypothetical protein PLIIFM63780_006650 [Purpureocillium lilacinum]|nr:hypothetical protein PLIIFM63780_006650 [Purpureocillium lilacinum]